MTATGPTVVRSRFSRGAAAAIVLAVLALVCWAFASPVGSTPDDDYHLPSIWCGAGDRDGLCAEDASGEVIEIPRDLFVSTCYAYEPETSAACQELESDNAGPTADSERNNRLLGLYPPVFYFVMSLFASGSVEVAVLVMRILNVLLFVGLVSAVALLVPRRWTVPYLWSILVTVVPFGMFLIPSTNPSSWAIISAATVWAATLGYLESDGRRRIALGALAAVALLVGAGARSDAAVYGAFAVTLAVLISFRRERRHLLTLVLPLALLVIAGVFVLISRQTSAISTGLTLPPDDSAAVASPWGFVLPNLINVPDLWAGAFGKWSLGWLDTPMPAAVWVLGLGIFAAVVLGGLANGGRRRLIALGLVVLAMIAVPTVLLVQTRTFVGGYVQPRYILPLLILLAGLALLPGARSLAPTRLQLIVVSASLALANSLALHQNIRRYTTGTDVGGVNLAGEWWWDLPIGPMVVWAVGSAAFGGLLAVAAASTWPSATAQTELDRKVPA